MILVFKKIWRFSKDEQANIKLAILYKLLHVFFNALQFGAIYLMLKDIFAHNVTSKTITYCTLMLIVSLIGKVYTLSKSQMKDTHAGYFTAYIKRDEIANKLKKVPMGFFSENSLGKITAISTTTLQQIESWVPLALVLILSGMIETVIFVLLMFIVDTRIALIAVCGVIVFMLVTALLEKRSRKNAKELQESTNTLTKQILSTILGIQVIKSYNLDGKNNKELTNAIDDSYKVTKGLEQLIVPYATLQKIVFGVTTGLMVYTAIRLNISHELALVDTIMVMIASFVIFEGMSVAGLNMAIVRLIENAIDSYEYMKQMPDIEEGSIDHGIQNYDIEFNNVSFAYGDQMILDGINCVMKQGSMSAIVGPSGSGKTTLCHLIARFYDVQNGEIRIGGTNINDYTLSYLNQQIAMVFQDVYLFEDTIENNIKFANPNASLEEVIEAAKKAQCHEFIMNLEDGYQTILKEGGSTISGGERQRISIARAILKDAPIIIFDEATANVDPENEYELQMAIHELTKDKTIIMIAHRLKTIRNANQIFVLNQHKIEQSGTHEELMKEGGLYKQLVDTKTLETTWKLESTK